MNKGGGKIERENGQKVGLGGKRMHRERKVKRLKLREKKKKKKGGP